MTVLIGPGIADNKIFNSDVITEQSKIIWLCRGRPAFVLIEIGDENNSMTVHVQITEPGYTFCLKVDDGEQLSCTDFCVWYFKFEGKHIIEYWFQDSEGNNELHSILFLLFDITPPEVTITSPEAGGIYFLGRKITNHKDKTVCIGKVPIVADATDEGSGVSMVFFNIGNDSGYDSTAPYEYTYKGTHFGELTISVTAIDKNGIISEPAQITVMVFSLGIL